MTSPNSSYPAMSGCSVLPAEVWLSPYGWSQAMLSKHAKAVFQWPFQERIHWRYLPDRWPIFQAYERGYPRKIWPYMVQDLHLGSWNFHWMLIVICQCVARPTAPCDSMAPLRKGCISIKMICIPRITDVFDVSQKSKAPEMCNSQIYNDL